MATSDIWVVNKANIYIRSNPGDKEKIIGALQHGTEIIELENKTIGNKLWIKHAKGWSSSENLKKVNELSKDDEEIGDQYNIASILRSGPFRAPVLGNNNVETITENSPATDNASRKRIGNIQAETFASQGVYIRDGKTTNLLDMDSGYGYIYGDSSMAGSKDDYSGSTYAKVKNVEGCFGLPYQFLPSADPRLGDGSIDTIDGVGFEYADRIVDRMPILLLAPGKVDFLSKQSASDKKAMIERLISYGTGGSDLIGTSELSSKNMRYFDFAYARSEYYSYVNPMCNAAARCMKVPSSYENWESKTQLNVGSIANLGTMNFIPFYVDSDASISESFSNTTTQSMLASTVNSISDMGRELSFLLGGTGSLENMDSILNNPEVQNSMENVNNLVNGLLNGRNNSFLSNLGSHLTTVAAGGKLIFPEIWSDSSFNRSYNITIKLSSPDPSNESVYLNVIVPLMHLIALVGPKQAIDNVNGYVSPFLVRAVYKGFFNIDLGIITSMSVTKGAECQWTRDGVPTSVVVSFEIKDLYPTMSITQTNLTTGVHTTDNTALMDYIANLCGVNPYDIDVGRAVSTWYTTNIVGAIADSFTLGIWANIKDKFGNAITDIWRGGR